MTVAIATIDAEIVADYTEDQFRADLTAVAEATNALDRIIQDAEQQATSLDYAARLYRAFTDGRDFWSPEVMPKKPTRMTDPYSLSRFATYLRRHDISKPARAYQLIAAHRIEGLFSTAVENRPTAEWQLRPLGALLKLDAEDEIPVLWERAVEKAGGLPTYKQVVAEVTEWKKDRGIIGRKAIGPGSGPRKESFSEKISRMLGTARTTVEALFDVDLDAAERFLRTELARIETIRAQDAQQSRKTLEAAMRGTS